MAVAQNRALEVQLLGPPSYKALGQPLWFRTRSDEFLLVYLSLHCGRLLSRHVVQEKVWPDKSREAGRRSVTQSLSRLRCGTKDVCDCPWSRGERIGLCRHVAVDVDLFRSLTKSTVLGDRLAALELWEDTPLLGIDAPWADSVRAGLEGAYRRLVLDTIPLLLDAERHTEARRWLSTASALDMLDEEVARAWINASGRARRYGEAQAVYNALEDNLREELEVEPEQSTRDALKRVMESRPSAPPLRSRNRRNIVRRGVMLRRATKSVDTSRPRRD